MERLRGRPLLVTLCTNRISAQRYDYSVSDRLFATRTPIRLASTDRALNWLLLLTARCWPLPAAHCPRSCPLHCCTLENCRLLHSVPSFLIHPRVTSRQANTHSLPTTPPPNPPLADRNALRSVFFLRRLEIVRS